MSSKEHSGITINDLGGRTFEQAVLEHTSQGNPDKVAELLEFCPYSKEEKLVLLQNANENAYKHYQEAAQHSRQSSDSFGDKFFRNKANEARKRAQKIKSELKTQRRTRKKQ